MKRMTLICLLALQCLQLANACDCQAKKIASEESAEQTRQ